MAARTRLCTPKSKLGSIPAVITEYRCLPSHLKCHKHCFFTSKCPVNLCEVVSLYAAVWATPCSLSYLLLNRKTSPDQAEMGMEMINYRSKLIKWCTRAICQKPQSKHYLQQKKILLHNIWLHHKQIYSTSDVQFSVRALNSSKFSIKNEPQFWTWIF